MENSLLPLKEYYLANPLNFDANDACLMEKARNFTDKKKEKNERFKDDNERD